MTILHVVTGLAPAGAELLLVEVAARLVSRGWCVHVLCLRSGVLVPKLQQYGVVANSLDAAKGDPRIIVSLHKYIQKCRPDIVHAHLFEAEVFCGLTSLLWPDIPFVCTRHGLDPFRARLPFRIVNSVCNIQYRCIIAISRAVGDLSVASGAPRERIVELPNGINLLRYTPGNPELKGSLRDKWKFTGKRIVGCVGRLCAEKGHRHLIEAWAIVVRRYPDAQLVLVGDGLLRKELELQTVDLGVLGSVRFMGHQGDDVAELLQCFDLFAFPSLREGFGIAVIEAMAAGIPVVATAVGGVPEVLGRDGGVLVPKANAEALAQAIILLLSDPERLCALGWTGHRRVCANFGIETHVDRLEAIYRLPSILPASPERGTPSSP